MKAADRSGAPLVVIVGDNDREQGIAQVKTMGTGEQEPRPWDGLADWLAATISGETTQQGKDAR